MLRAAEGAVDEADLGRHERAARLKGQAGGGRIVGEQRPELDPGGMRLEMREILQGELSAAEDLDGRRLSACEGMDGRRLGADDGMDGRRWGVLHTVFSVPVECGTHCKVTTFSADCQGNRGISSHNVS